MWESRYHVGLLATMPSGCTIRSVSAPPTVDVVEPYLDTADHRVVKFVEKPGWSGFGQVGSPVSWIDDDR